MCALFRIALAVSAMALAAPATAQSTTKFDGTYAGVSRDVTADNSKSSCTRGDNHYVLTIANGTATLPWGTAGQLGGQITPTGALTMRATSGSITAHFDGQIDPTGKVTANVLVYNCGYLMVWQKK